jgi:hypothetical protein
MASGRKAPQGRIGYARWLLVPRPLAGVFLWAGAAVALAIVVAEWRHSSQSNPPGPSTTRVVIEAANSSTGLPLRPEGIVAPTDSNVTPARQPTKTDLPAPAPLAAFVVPRLSASGAYRLGEHEISTQPGGSIFVRKERKGSNELDVTIMIGESGFYAQGVHLVLDRGDASAKATVSDYSDAGPTTTYRDDVTGFVEMSSWNIEGPIVLNVALHSCQDDPTSWFRARVLLDE